jgi:hypothetical protein
MSVSNPKLGGFRRFFGPDSGADGGGGNFSTLELIPDLLKSASARNGETPPTDQAAPTGAPTDGLSAAVLTMVKDLLLKSAGPLLVSQIAKALPSVDPALLANLLVWADANGQLLVRKTPAEGIVVDVKRPGA